MSACRANLERFDQAMQNHLKLRGTYPPADSWLESLSAFDPELAQLRCPTGATSYVFNANLAGMEPQRVNGANGTVLIYEGSPAVRADTGQAWIPSGVHGASTNVLMADGVVQTVGSRAQLELQGHESTWATYLTAPRRSEPQFEDPQFDPSR